MNLLAEVKSLSKKITKNDFESKKDDYINRITKLIIKHAVMGENKIYLRKIPCRRQYLSQDPKMFLAIAKHFASLGFEICYTSKNSGNYFNFTASSANRPFPIPANDADCPYNFLIIAWLDS